MTTVSADPRLAIVVVTRNRRASLLRTLSQLTSLEAAYPIVVVDNGSVDGTADAVAAMFPAVAVLPLGHNMGSAARTAGVQRVTTPFVAFADDDSWWAPGALARAIALLDCHSRIALVAGRIVVGADEREDPTCARMARSPLPHHAAAPGMPILGFLACGAIVRREAFLDAGGFHSRFGIGGEEGVLAADLARRGWWLRYVPAVVCHHHPSPSRDPLDRRRIETRNQLWTAWLRRTRGTALAATWATARQSARDPAVRRGVLSALAGLPWVLRERDPVPVWLEDQLRLLDRHEAAYDQA